MTASGIAVGGNAGVGIRVSQLEPRRPEEPDVRTTSPVPWELGVGNCPWLPDVRPAWTQRMEVKVLWGPRRREPQAEEARALLKRTWGEGAARWRPVEA
jgi:hypothetical protein